MNTVAHAIAAALTELVDTLAHDAGLEDTRRVRLSGTEVLFGTVYRSDVAHELRLEATLVGHDEDGIRVRLGGRIEGPVRNHDIREELALWGADQGDERRAVTAIRTALGIRD